MAQPVMEPTRERAPLRPADPNVVPLVRPARKRPSWVLLGVVLVGAAALLGAVVFSSSTSQISIVVAARDLAPGEVIAATDLRVVEIGSTGEMRAIQSSQQSLVIVQAALGPIPAGTAVNRSLSVESRTAVSDGCASGLAWQHGCGRGPLAPRHQLCGKVDTHGTHVAAGAA